MINFHWSVFCIGDFSIFLKKMNYSKILKERLSVVQKKHIRRFKSLLWGTRRYLTKDLSSPDFLIIGTQRGGTSSLHFLLLQHPCVLPGAVKEIHYFDNPIIRRRGENWYRSQFPSTSSMRRLSEALGENVITGEATPFMYSFHAPRFVQEITPNVKIIVLLRDPIERAISHYFRNRLVEGREPLTVEEAFLNENQRIKEEYERSITDQNFDDKNNRKFSYISRGFYDEQIERWYKHFDESQILLVDSLELFTNPHGTLAKVTEFLCISQNYNFDTSVKLNFGNQKKKISDDLNFYLKSIYESHNVRLEQITGRKFSWIE